MEEHSKSRNALSSEYIKDYIDIPMTNTLPGSVVLHKFAQDYDNTNTTVIHLEGEKQKIENLPKFERVRSAKIDKNEKIMDKLIDEYMAKKKN